MKTVRVLLLVIFFCGGPIASSASETVPPQSEFPDLLADEFGDNDSADLNPVLTIVDPFEPVNRLFFKFNDQLYEWVLKPATDAYIWVFPRDLRDCFGNFFFNMAAPVRLLNAVLQGDLGLTGTVLSRFLINSTLGVYGLVDVAAIEFEFSPERADFGQTLGKWGLGEGIYFCWPLFGPSSVRDTLGMAVDAYAHPVPYFHQNPVLDLAYYTTNRINTLSLKPDLYDDLKRYALDPYVASRQAYYEYRKALIERP